MTIDKRFECDRNCVGMNEPIEDCSAHGRTPRDLWEQIDKVAAEREAALAAIERVAAEIEAEMGQPSSPYEEGINEGLRLAAEVVRRER